MVLSIRSKQTEALVRMLRLNAPTPTVPGTAQTPDAEIYKVLVLDRQTKDIIAPLLRVSDLRRHGVTLHLMMDAERHSIPDVPAVYFVGASDGAVTRIVQDAASGLYDSFHLNFVTFIPATLMEQLAAGAVAASCVQRIAKVHDQYLAFVALEASLFSLGLPRTYLELNDPAAGESQIEAALATIVDGVFSAVATLGVVPIIRCPQGGLAQVFASKLDGRIREHLKLRNNLFSESASGLAASLSRPLLCLFDRNYELSVMLQHTWTYRPLVHDVLGMALNRIALEAEPSSAPTPLAAAKPAGKRSVEVGEGDFFWEANARSTFPKVAADVDVQLTKYKQAVEDMNRQTGARVDPNATPDDMMSGASHTRGLMSAVSQLPQLIERKRTIEKHSSILHQLLGDIKRRSLDHFYNLEEDMLGGKVPFATLVQLLQGAKGTPSDKLRAALVYLSTCPTPPGDGEYAEMERALQESAPGADLAALHYVRRMRRMKLTGRAGADGLAASAAPSGGALSNLATGSSSHLLSWADKTFGQGLTSLTKGVKDLLAGEQQAAVTVAVEGLMDAKPPPELEAFATFDPRAAPGKPSRAAGPYREAIVFMIGGGSYLEAESLATWASRAQPQKTVIYGATDLLNGEQFAAQLAELGRRSGSV